MARPGKHCKAYRKAAANICAVPLFSRTIAIAAGGAVQGCEATGRRRVVPDLEGALDRLDLGASAPARDKAARQTRIAEIDRDRVVDYAAQPRGGHRPALAAAIVVEPRLDFVEPDA